jgi:hypothetical protein
MERRGTRYVKIAELNLTVPYKKRGSSTHQMFAFNKAWCSGVGQAVYAFYGMSLFRDRLTIGHITRRHSESIRIGQG